uniref:EMI domain-containing protein n=1 Tax=Ornithorhynchus anatinus TaxID=9258 RepID=A0A6I8PEJ5_ORNAN
MPAELAEVFPERRAGAVTVEADSLSVVSYRTLIRPTYRVSYRTVTALEWRCCPGFAGSSCEEECMNCTHLSSMSERLATLEGKILLLEETERTPTPENGLPLPRATAPRNEGFPPDAIPLSDPRAAGRKAGAPAGEGDGGGERSPLPQRPVVGGGVGSQMNDPQRSRPGRMNLELQEGQSPASPPTPVGSQKPQRGCSFSLSRRTAGTGGTPGAPGAERRPGSGGGEGARRAAG